MGVTTAATIWFVTVMGLCFGGGQLGLGLAAFPVCFLVLTGLKTFELSMRREQNATLKVTVSADGPTQDGKLRPCSGVLAFHLQTPLFFRRERLCKAGALDGNCNGRVSPTRKILPGRFRIWRRGRTYCFSNLRDEVNRW